MATTEQVRRLLSDVTTSQQNVPMTPIPSMTPIPPTREPTTGEIIAELLAMGWSASDITNMPPETRNLVIQYGIPPGGITGGNAQVVGSATSGYYERDPQTGQWNLVIGGTGGGAGDPLIAQLRAQQIAASQAEQARAAEMQPYDIANIQSTIQARQAEEEYNSRNLQRQTLSDQFTRAQDAFESARLAESLALEKKRTATSLLTSIVDNLVPAGMTSLPGLPGSTMPVVGNIDWNQITTGLNPETDAALRYLMGLQRQNAGV